ncbi:MAG: response regulator [Anaerolineales bacterium]|nr:response regulator [Anaerolineales bacterium]
MISLKGKRIFYIEDNLQNRALVQLMLERYGATISFERWGGDDLLPRLEAFLPIDLILLDLMFPNHVSGYDIFDRIRERPAFAEIPIVAISAADPAVEMSKARAKGFSGFIGKPINLLQFPQQIAQLLEGEQVWYAL